MEGLQIIWKLRYYITCCFLGFLSKATAERCHVLGDDGISRFYGCEHGQFCCPHGCCYGNVWSLYRLWYLWLCLFLLMLLCSGGGYWYKRRYYNQPHFRPTWAAATTARNRAAGRRYGGPGGHHILWSMSPPAVLIAEAPPTRHLPPVSIQSNVVMTECPAVPPTYIDATAYPPPYASEAPPTYDEVIELSQTNKNQSGAQQVTGSTA